MTREDKLQEIVDYLKSLGYFKSAQTLVEEAGLFKELKVENSEILLKEFKKDLNLRLNCFKWNPSLSICAIGSHNGLLYLLSNNDLIQSFKLHSGLISNLEWDLTGKLLATASKDCKVKIHEILKNKISTLYTLNHSDYVSDLVFSKNTLITACKDCKIYIWDYKNQEILRTFNHSDWVRSLDFSDEFSLLLSGSGHVF